MFNIIFNKKIYRVYSVKCDKKGTYFLIYNYKEWQWVPIHDCKLVENLKG